MKKRNDQNVIVKRAVLVFILMFLVLLAALAFFTRSIVMREQLKASYTAEATVANVEAQLNRYLAAVPEARRVPLFPARDGHSPLNDSVLDRKSVV